MTTAVVKYYIGDTGTEIVADTGSAVAGATSLNLLVLKPEATAQTVWVGAAYETTKIRYITTSADFSVDGVYKVQAQVVSASGSWRGSVANFRVYKPFE
jgi:hypothetical protein